MQQESTRRKLIVIMRNEYRKLEHRKMGLEEQVTEIAKVIEELFNTNINGMMYETYKRLYESLARMLKKKLELAGTYYDDKKERDDKIQEKQDMTMSTVALCEHFFNQILGVPVPEVIANLPANHPSREAVSREVLAQALSVIRAEQQALRAKERMEKAEKVVIHKTVAPKSQAPTVCVRTRVKVHRHDGAGGEPASLKRTPSELISEYDEDMETMPSPPFGLLEEQVVAAPVVIAAPIAPPAVIATPIAAPVAAPIAAPTANDLRSVYEIADSFFNPLGNTPTDVAPCCKRGAKFQLVPHIVSSSQDLHPSLYRPITLVTQEEPEVLKRKYACFSHKDRLKKVMDMNFEQLMSGEINLYTVQLDDICN